MEHLAKYSDHVVKSCDANLLSHFESKIEFILYHKLHILWLVLPLVRVIDVEFSHIHLDVFVDICISQHHQNLSLSSHFVKDIRVDLSRKNVFVSLLKGKVHEDLLDLVVLLELFFRGNKLGGIVHVVEFFLSNIFKLLGLKRLVSVLVLVLASFLLKATDWNQLSKQEELQILVHSKFLAKSVDELFGMSTLDLVFTVLFEDVHDFSN